MIASKLLYILLALNIIPITASFIYPAAALLSTFINLALFLLLVIDYFSTQSPDFINAIRTTDNRFSIGCKNDVTVKVINLGNHSLHCQFRDDYPMPLAASAEEFSFVLPGSGLATISYTLVPRKRGRYEFGNLNLRYLSRFGLFWRQKRIKANQEIRVFSDLQALHRIFLKLGRGTAPGELRKLSLGKGTEFASLREYTEGDDVRSIDWNATARKARPIVRTYETDQEQVLLILVDAGRSMISDLEGLSKFDHALNSALALSLAGISRNDQVGLGIFADKPLLYLPAHRGKLQQKKFLESVFDIQPHKVEPDYMGVLSYFATMQKGRCLMVVITDLTDSIGSQTLLTGLSQLRSRHLPFCVTLKDRQLDKLAQEPSEDLDSIYKRAVAVDLINQRNLALSTLIKNGVLVLDCPPQELSDKLIENYLEIKNKSRL